MSSSGSGPSMEAFRDRLQSLKRSGCAVLVTGEVREAISQRMTRKLLGAAEEPRTRVLGLIDQDREDVPNLLPGDATPRDGRVYLVDYGGTRAAAEASPGHEDAGWRWDDLDELRTTLCDAMATAKIGASGFDPSELRLSLFTLSPLVYRHDPAAVDRFVTTVGDHVRGTRGMAHFHLPIPDDSTPVRRLSPLFDARVELREKRGRPEQRWHFPEPDEPTAWFGLSA